MAFRRRARECNITTGNFIAGDTVGLLIREGAPLHLPGYRLRGNYVIRLTELRGNLGNWGEVE